MSKVKIVFKSEDCDGHTLIIHSYAKGTGMIQIESRDFTLGFLPSSTEELGQIIAVLTWIHEERELDDLYIEAMGKDD